MKNINFEVIFYFNACDQKLLLVTFYVKPYLLYIGDEAGPNELELLLFLLGTPKKKSKNSVSLMVSMLK